MYTDRIAVIVTTLADGTATAYTPHIEYGELSQIRYVKSSFSNGAALLITVEATGETLWSQTGVDSSATVAPRQATHTTLGAAALYAGGGSAVLDRIAIGKSRIKIVLSGAGNVTTGTYHFTLV